MFYECNNLNYLDLSSFDTKNVTNMSDMFYWCCNLNNLVFLLLILKMLLK